VDHHGASVEGAAGLHPAEEGQGGGGVLWDTVVRPGQELELFHLPPLAGAVL